MRRVYVLSILSFLLLAVFPQFTFAHTKLQSSSPEPDATVVTEMKEIIMEFNTEVEPLSSFKLTKEDGTELKIGNIEIIENRIVGTFDERLPNGAYTADWKIVGRDGHPIQGDFKFTIDVPVAIATAEPTEAPSQALPEAEAAPQPDNAKNNMIDHGTTGQDREQAGFWIAAGVVIVALIVLVFGTRRKK